MKIFSEKKIWRKQKKVLIFAPRKTEKRVTESGDLESKTLILSSLKIRKQLGSVEVI